MIIDCTMFNNEYDLLEIRMRELFDVVDHFVIVESDHDHRGNPKTEMLNNRIHQYTWAWEKMVIVTSGLPDQYESPWDLERYQRSVGVIQAMDILEPGPDDFFLMSDVDEIFRAEAVKEMANAGGIYTVHMPMYYYYFNLFVHDWYHPKAFSFKHIYDPNVMRLDDPSKMGLVRNGGWHFSYLGNAKKIQKKLKSFAHSEYDSPEYTDLDRIQQAIDSGRDLFGRFGDSEFQKMEIDDSWPRYIVENKEKFKKYIVEA